MMMSYYKNTGGEIVADHVLMVRWLSLMGKDQLYQHVLLLLHSHADEKYCCSNDFNRAFLIASISHYYTLFYQHK